MNGDFGYASLSLTPSPSAGTRLDARDAQYFLPVSELNLIHLTRPVRPDHYPSISRYVPDPAPCPTISSALQSSHQDHNSLLQHSGVPADLTLPTRLEENLTSRSSPVNVASKSDQAYPQGHMQTSSTIPSFLCLPDLHTEDIKSSSSTSASHSNTSNRRSPSISASVRSLSQKRKPPASHSSYGVETVNGPPPSYSTQKKLSQDRLRNGERSPTLRSLNTSDNDNSSANILVNNYATFPAHDSSLLEDSLDLSNPLPRGRANSISSSLDDHNFPIIRGMSGTMTENKRNTVILRNDVDEDVTVTAPKLSHTHTKDTEGAQDDTKESSSDEHKSEDLFLNIAKTDASRYAQPTVRNGQRRSRISLPFFSTSRPNSSHKSSPITTPLNQDISSSRSEASHSFRARSSLGPHVPGAFSRSYIDDVSSHRETILETTSEMEPVDGANRTTKRRFSNTNTDTLRPPSRAYTGRAGRSILEAAYNETGKTGDVDAAESTISTTAPSTVWDELDDLKSRIKKLELTGKLPPSSAAAMNSVERPRTATTAATNLSTSPKHQLAGSNLQSAIDGIPPTIHPLLHEALGNMKAVVNNEIYQKLHATAQDALQLSAMMSGDGVSGFGTANALPPVSERQIRRKTESMCRSLTELAIAMLAESRTTSSTVNRPASRSAMTGSMSGLRNHRLSNEPSDRPQVAPRVQSRLENRRRSSHLGELQSLDSSHPALLQTPPVNIPSQPTSSSRSSRVVSTSARHRRGQELLDGSTELTDPSPLVRPASRAMTEGGVYRPKARDTANFSREYTKQHPLPGQTESPATSGSPFSNSLGSNFVTRRAYASPASVISTQDSSPVTPAPRYAPSWGNITIERRDSSPAEPTSDSNNASRATGGRRSLGLASRISNVGSRLRAVRGDRTGNNREGLNMRSGKEMASSQEEAENQPHEARHETQVDDA